MVTENPAHGTNVTKSEAAEPLPFKVSGLQLSDDDGAGWPGNSLNATQVAGLPDPDKPALDR